MPVSVARPGLVYGPGDLHLLGFFSSIKKGRPCLIDGGKALIHPIYIDDMTAAFCCAPKDRRPSASATTSPGTTRHLSRTSYRHCARAGKTLPKGDIPLWLANLASDIFALVPGLKGENAPLTRSRVKFLTNSRVYDIGQSQKRSGLRASFAA